MAKTRMDFVEEGRRSARMGNTRSPGGEWTMPVFGVGPSWQAKAFAEGFNEVKDAAYIADYAGAITKTPAHVTALKRPDQAVIAHINMLHRMRATTTPDRAARLLRKIDALKVRHSPI